MAERLSATYAEGNAGLWSITCEACPIAHHAAAVNIKPPRCLGGIATNMQGPIVLDTCRNTSSETLANEGDALTIECRYEPTP